MNTQILRLNALVASLALVCASCGERSKEEGAPGGVSPQVITIDGSSTVFPITEAVAEEFQKVHRGSRVTIGSSGTGGGFQKFCRDETDISNASRPIRSTEIEACSKAGITFAELPISYDGLAVVVHPRNTWVNWMTVAELKRLWEPAAERKITRWSQIRTGWPDRQINLFGPGVDSGTFDYFTEAIVGKARASRGDYTSSEDDNVLVQGVATDEGALGYFGYAYYEQNKSRLKLVPIDDQKDDNGKGPIGPSPETVRNGTYQPLSRPLFIYVNAKALSRPEVTSFVEYYLTNSAALVREVGYVPLSDREYELTRERFRAGTTGTLFDGRSLSPGMTLEQVMTRSKT